MESWSGVSWGDLLETLDDSSDCELGTIGNCPERDGGVYTEHLTERAHTHIFLVERVTFHSCALCMAQDVFG